MSTATQLFEDIRQKKQATIEENWPKYSKLLKEIAKGSDKVDAAAAQDTLEAMGIGEEQLTADVELTQKRQQAVANYKIGLEAMKELMELGKESEANQKLLNEFMEQHKAKQKALGEKMQAASRKHSTGARAADLLTDISKVLDPRLKREHEEIQNRRMDAYQRVQQLEENRKFLQSDLGKLATDEDKHRVAPSTLERDKKRAEGLEKRIVEVNTKIREIQTVEVAAIESDATKLREKLLKTV